MSIDRLTYHYESIESLTMSGISEAKSEEFLKSYTFKICGIDKEVSLQLSGRQIEFRTIFHNYNHNVFTGQTSVSTILEQLSSFCAIKSSALQIRNGNESLNDINKKLSEYNIEDPSKLYTHTHIQLYTVYSILFTFSFLVLRDDILDDDYDKDDEESKETEEEDEDIENVDEDAMSSQLIYLKSPPVPAVPNNSFVTESNITKQQQSQGLYSALESLASSNNKKQLNSLSPQKNQK